MVAVVTFATWGAAHAQVPKPEDVAACNKLAQEAVAKRTGSPPASSPTRKDEGRAAEARRGTTQTDSTGTITRSPDPQIEGMDAEGAKDPLYQATYRSCMRQSGF